ncbi:MAG: PAS domain-containing protein [Cyclobacteriaceae bacterium]|nr:PAS domain-containing protein [Cyclobacteriaceae bacterium]MCH8517163.1 PAS domain-containing protein [Cyclobacteriaceae bacterium]
MKAYLSQDSEKGVLFSQIKKVEKNFPSKRISEYAVEKAAALHAKKVNTQFNKLVNSDLTQKQKLFDATEALSIQLESLLSIENKKLASFEEEILNNTATLYHFNLSLLGLIAVLFTWAMFALTNQIFAILKAVRTELERLNKGETSLKFRMINDESSRFYGLFQGLSNHLKAIEQFAKGVGAGNFDQKVAQFSEMGELGNALIDMQDSLKGVSEAEKRRIWVNESLGAQNEFLRSNHSSKQVLFDEGLKVIMQALNATQGALYILNNFADDKTKIDSGEIYLETASCYAFERKKKLKEQLSYGDGLAGQCWRDEDEIYLTEIPENYLKIKSGLGDATPTNLILIPLIYTEQIIGVLEIASFKIYEDHEREYLKKSSNAFAASIFSVVNTENTAKLLEESQMMSESIQAQEEEMRQNMEELLSTQEKLVQSQEQIERKERNLSAVIDNTSDTIFAVDIDYNITVVNKTIVEKYAKLGIELRIGANLLDGLPLELKRSWKDRIDRCLKGESFQMIIEQKDRFLEANHNPINDENGQISGVAIMSRDITEILSNQKQLEKQEKVINAIINNTDDTFFAIDTEYKITVVNQTLKNRFASSGISLNPGENILDKLPEESRKLWKERYDRVLSGEDFTILEERQLENQTLFIEVIHKVIRDEEGNLIGASVTSRDITRWKEAILEKKEREAEIEKLREALGRVEVKNLPN